MKWILRLWLVTFGIILIWIYFLFISPKIFNNHIVTIPNVVNLSEEQAIKQLNKNKIKYQITYIESEEEVALKTVPYAGTNIKSDYVISLYVGKIMPAAYKSYLGRVYENIADEIELMCNNHGLKLKLEYEETDNTISGVIIRESLVDGSILNQGDELCLTISTNHSSYMLPDFVGMTIDDALKLITEYNIKVNLTYIPTPVDEDIIIFQSTPPSTLIQKNNPYALDLYISKGVKPTMVVDVDFFIEVIHNLGYDMEINYVNSNDLENKLVAFDVQKLYDSNIVKYILWITK
ncbi:MAG: PASTA domain-containing protein [Anaeroplasmataceae bacterium]|nr:PASTA domain-containing protein [Anaeroplasmataceae bacterium]MDE6414845.1 PASTA domain-containing protein [Anaeroplasmataceae bacterium]